MAFESFFKDRVYAISGGASGIGVATVKLLLKYGARVSIGDIRFPDDLLSSQLVPEITYHESPGGNIGPEEIVLLKKVDVRSREDVEGWMAATVEKFGRLDGAANLAGRFRRTIMSGASRMLKTSSGNS